MRGLLLLPLVNFALAGLLLVPGFSAAGAQTVTTSAGSVSLGTVNVCSGGAPAPCASTATLTFTFGTGGTIKAPVVLTTGATGLDFTDAGTGTCTTNGTSHTYNSGNSCSVIVNFTPKAAGQRFGAVELLNSSGSVLVTALLTGTGKGPVVIFPGNTSVAVLGGGFGFTPSVAVDAAGNVYLSDLHSNSVKEILAVGGSIPANNPTILTLGSGFNIPAGVAVDGAGNVYVADANNNAVKEIVAVAGSIPASNPTIRTLGSGFRLPSAVVVDSAGNVYVGDVNNQAMKEIVAVGGSIPASNPTILTLGSGFNSPSSIAVDGAGNVYVADANESAVKELVAVGGSIPASNPTIRTLGSGFSVPKGVAVDSAGNVYVGDAGNGAAYEIVAVGGSIPASNPTIRTLGSGFLTPEGIAVDGAGNVFVADYGNGVVVEIPLATAPALTFASTTVGSTSSDSPQSVTIENVGNAALTFSSLATGSTSFPVSATGTCGTGASLAESASCTIAASFKPQHGGALAGTFTLTDNALGSTQTASLSGTGTTGTTTQTITFPQLVTPAMSGTTATLTASSTSGLAITYSVVSGPATVSGSVITYTGPGTVVIEADQYGSATYAAAAAVQRSVMVTFQSSVGVPSSNQTATVTITTGGTLGAIYVLTTGQPNLDYTFVSGGTCATGTVYAANATCTVNYSFTPKAPGQRLGAVQLVASDNTTILGTALLTGTGTGPAVVFPGNTSTTVLGSGFVAPEGVAVDAAGDVYVADVGLHAVFEIVAVGGSIPASLPTIRSLGSGFNRPYGVAVDGAGNVYVVDDNSKAIKEIIAVGGSIPVSNPTTRTLASGFSNPFGVTVDGVGNVFVSDTSSSVVQEIVAVGGSIPASNPTIRMLGSGFRGPFGTAVDGVGNVYVADTNNNAVKEIVAVGGSIPASNPTILTLGSGFSFPEGVAVDAAGNVYVGDAGNSSVKEIVAVGGSIPASNPTILTLGSGFNFPNAVTVDGAGNVYVADSYTGAVSEIPLTVPPSLSFASTNVGSTSSDSPQSVTVENVGNAAMTFSSLATGSSSFPISGTGTCSTGTPLAESGMCTIAASFTPQRGIALTGTFTLTDNSLNSPGSTQTVSLSGTGTTGTTTQTITFPQPVTPAMAGTTATLTASSTSGLAITFSVVSGPATVSGSTVSYTGPGTVVLEADQYGSATYAAAAAVQRSVTVTFQSSVGVPSSNQTATVTITTGGTLGTIYVLTTGQPNLDYTFVAGGTCAVGSVYAANATCTVGYKLTPKAPGQRLGAVQLVGNDGTTILGTALLTGTGTGPAVVFPGNTSTTVLGSGFNKTLGVAVDVAGNVYVADSGNNGVKEILAVGGSIPASNPTILTLGSGFRAPMDIALDGAGDVFVADANNNAVKEIVAVGGSIAASNPTILTLGSGFSFPSGVAVDGAGNVYVADTFNNAIDEIVAVGGSIPATNPTILALGSGFVSPNGVAVDATGNVYVADTGHSAVKEMVAVGGSIPASSPTIRTLGGGFNFPGGVAVDVAGNVYVADRANNAVKEMVAVGGSIPASNPTITTLGTFFSAPMGVALDGAGNVYVASNTASNPVEEILLTLPPGLSFASTHVGSTSSDSPKSVTVQNIGNAALLFTDPTMGGNPSISTGFSIGGSSTCPQLTNSSMSPGSLGADSSCTDLISFSPASGGTNSGSLVQSDNNLGGTDVMQTVNLSGTGTYLTPAITSISPNTGNIAGGTSVTITGTGLSGANSVKFGSTAAASFTVNSDTSLTAISPAESAGPVYIQVSNPASSSTNAAADQFTFLITPTITFSVPNHRTGDAPFTVSASSNSAGAITYSVVSGPATVSGSTVTLAGTGGTVMLQASQAANGNYSAESQTASFQVASGSVWLGNSNGTLSEFSFAGSPVGPGAISGGGLGTIGTPQAVAFDHAGNVWVATSNGVSEFALNGTAVQATAITSGDISSPVSLAIDGAGSVWVLNAGSTLSVLSNAGSAVNQYGVYPAGTGTSGAVAIDASGGVWVTNQSAGTVTQILSAATQVAPLARSISNNTIGMQP